MSIQYTVTLLNPQAHVFKVTLELASPDVSGQIFTLPAWIPGSYMIRDFAKNIITIHAHSENKEVILSKLDKSRWQAAPINGSLTVEYEIYAWDLSVRSAHLDMTHAFFNGTSLFLMPQGLEHQPPVLNILKPKDKSYSNWKLATSLTKKEVDATGFGTYQAKDYDELIDHPVEMGTFSEFEFSVAKTKHKMVLTGIHRADSKRLRQDLTKICQSHIKLFGELPALDEYLFLVMVTGDGYGGLEHRSSTSLMCSRDDLPLSIHTKEPDEKYRNFLGLCSHEYFHTWNIKRIKPAGFVPYDLSTETYTRQLWAFEGITSYYDELALVRSQVISVNSYLELLGQTITRVLRGKGRFRQSIADSSFEAWTRFYKQDESAPNTIVSYYTKGALLALCLDLTIRNHSGDEKSLDDVMRYLWLNYGKKAIGLAEGEIESICSDIAGMDLSPFFEKYLYGVEELPLENLLADMGINYHLRATTSVEDKGGLSVKADSDSNKAPTTFGARFAEDKLGAKITQVFSDESAELAGLSAGDTVIAINDLQITCSSINNVIGSYQVGDVLRVHAFRRDELKEFTVTLTEAELTTCYLTINDSANSEQQQRQKKWLFL